MTAPDSAIVVGGCLAGLSTALTLSRVGVAVTVLERNGSDRNRGAGLLVADGLVERLTGRTKASGQPSVSVSLTGGMHSWHSVYTTLRRAAEADPQVTFAYRQRGTASWAGRRYGMGRNRGRHFHGRPRHRRRRTQKLCPTSY